MSSLRGESGHEKRLSKTQMISKSKATNKAKTTTLIAITLLAVLSAGVACRVGPSASDYNKRVYKIGFGSNARPLHFADESGRPDGLAVNIVREAARRRGIQLMWVQSATPGLDAMKKGEVDFWVLMTDLPERHSQAHFTEPFLVAEYCFLVLADSPFKTVADLSNARVNSNGFEIIRKRLGELLPKAQFSVEPSPQKALDSLIAGSSDALFLEQYAASDLVLTGRPARKLKMIAAPVPRGYMGMAANFDVAPVADEIRDEMKAMESDGSLARIFGAWSFFPSQNVDATDSLSKAQRRVEFLIAGVAALLLCLATMVALLARIRAQRNKLRETERALGEREKDQRTLIQLLPDTIYVVSRGEKESGSAAYRLVQGDGLALDWLVASECHKQRVLEVLASGHPTMAELEAPDGRHLEYRLVPSREPGGTVNSVMGILRDRTEQRRAEQERANLEEQLRQAHKMEVVGRLAGGVAHDFNNLLTVIMGYSKMLLGRFAAESTEYTKLKQIDTAARSASTLTHQLLAFSRRQVIQPERQDLNRILADSGEMLGRLLGQDIQLETRLAPDLPWVVVDRVQVNLVLMNLAANSRDAMPYGGRFTISTERTIVTVDDAIHYQGAVPGPCVLLSVTDTGPGMDRATAAKIFEPFFTTKREGGSAGLGLSIVHGVVHQSGGRIQVDSRVGYGTTFHIYLPEAADALAESPSGEDEGESSPVLPASETILIVEDQESILNFEKEVLSACGYQVIGAITPAEALRASEGFHGVIHLLLTDVVLTEVRGPELARQIRKQRPKIKLLFASGYAGELQPERDRLILESEFLQKPFAAETLVDAVKRCLTTA